MAHGEFVIVSLWRAAQGAFCKMGGLGQHGIARRALKEEQKIEL
jgi:hypothetical protein